MLIDQLLPNWHARERHRQITSAAPNDLTAAAGHVTWGEVPVMRVLMRARSAGGLQLGTNRPILDDMSRIGFTLLTHNENELVAGAIGRPWSPKGGAPRDWASSDLAPADAFSEFSEPGWAKMALNFHAGGGELTTETRVLLTDDRSRRRFRSYWIVIRPFSGLIRRQWLAAIARRADLERT